jgi:cysteine desulfurase/selenocysteine lyase
VIDAISKYYQEINANIHRGVHTLSQLATDAYEISRGKIQNHINAKFSHEVLFPEPLLELIWLDLPLF